MGWLPRHLGFVRCSSKVGVSSSGKCGTHDKAFSGTATGAEPQAGIIFEYRQYSRQLAAPGTTQSPGPRRRGRPLDHAGQPARAGHCPRTPAPALVGRAALFLLRVPAVGLRLRLAFSIHRPPGVPGAVPTQTLAGRDSLWPRGWPVGLAIPGPFAPANCAGGIPRQCGFLGGDVPVSNRLWAVVCLFRALRFFHAAYPPAAGCHGHDGGVGRFRGDTWSWGTIPPCPRSL